MIAEFAELLLEVRSHVVCRSRNQVLLLNESDVRQSSGTTHRMSTVGKSMSKISTVQEGVCDLVSDHGCSQWHVATGEAFRQAHEIRIQVPQIARKPCAETSEAGDHFVGDE